MELIGDRNFLRGFYLQGPDPSAHDRWVEKIVSPFPQNEQKPLWWVAQWWTPFPFSKAAPKQRGEEMVWENESRRFVWNPQSGRFSMDLDSHKEYEALYQSPRASSKTPWSHFLLEQDFEDSPNVEELSSLRAKIRFSVEKCALFDRERFNPSLHAAQLLWYLTIQPQKGPYSPAGKNFIWLGLPLFDSRTPYEEKAAFLDVGNPGSTNRLIYNLDSRDYLPSPVEIGEEYSVDFDLLPKAKEAIAYAREHGILPPSGPLYVNYMNFGWELPGSYEASASIQAISLEAEL